MTNAELIATIRAEIEKKYNESHEKKILAHGDKDYYNETAYGAEMGVYNRLLSFLSDLEKSEKQSSPTIKEPIDGILYAAACGIKNATEKAKVDLEKEIDKYCEPIQAWQIQEAPFTSIDNCARHFYELGKMHSRKHTMDELGIDLETEIDKEWKKCLPTDEGMGLERANIVNEQFGEIARHFFAIGHSIPLPEDTVLFNKGVEEGKRLMMEEAVEYEVGMHGEPINITLDKYVQRAKGIFPGDKVRIIVCKKED